MGSHATREDFAPIADSPTSDSRPATSSKHSDAETMADWIGDYTGHPYPPPRPKAPAPPPPELSTYGVDDGDLEPAAPSRNSQLHSNPQKLTFDAVSGLATLSKDVELTNDSKNAVGVRVTIEGHHPHMFTHSNAFGAIVQPMRANALPEALGITYRPTAPGHHTAVLVLRSDIGTIHVQLEGDALDARPGGPATTTPGTPEAAREHALAAATDAARLASEYSTAVASTDAARDSFASRILGAGTRLNAKLIGWLAEEGVTAAYATEEGSRASNTSDITKFLLLEVAERGLEVAGMSNPISAAALVAVDLGWDMVEAGRSNDEGATRRRETVETIETVGSWASDASTDVTQHLVKRYSSLMSSYEIAKARLRSAADAGVEIKHLRDRIGHNEDPSATIEPLQTARDSFRQNLDHLHLVLRTIAAEAAQAEPRATQAFTKLLDSYLRFRATGDPESPAHTRLIVTDGRLNVGAPRPIELTGTRIGAVDASTLGPSSAFVATRRPLDEMTGWNVSINLTSPAGDLALHQREKGDRIQVIPDAVMPLVDQIGGIASLWSAVDRARVGK